MKQTLLLILLIIATKLAFSQNVTNVQVKQIGKVVHVSYTLDKTADITLHLSTDGGVTYSEPLKLVSGDVGKNIPAGTHTIVWDVLAERERLYSDEIIFMVKANIISIKTNQNFNNNNFSYDNIRNLDEESIKKKIIEVLENYYKVNNKKTLSDFKILFTNPIEQYYSKSNYYLENLIIEQEKYLKKFEYQSITFYKNSITIVENLKEGFFDVSYNIEVVVKNLSTGKIIKFYEKINTKWNSQFKIFYLTETIISKEILN